MSSLRKSYSYVRVRDGEPGRAGRQAVPPRDGYWFTRTVTEYTPIQSSDTSSTGGLSMSLPSEDSSLGYIEDDQYILKLEWQFLRYYAPRISSTLQGIMDAIDAGYERGDDQAEEGTPTYEDFQKLWEDYEAEVTRILQAQIDTGTLGRKLFDLSYTWGENAYVAAWDGGEGVWFFSFQGFDPDDRPTQSIVS